MIKSMTGFGKAECQLSDKKVSIEIKSLNSKQMDISMRMPPLYREKEAEIRQMITSTLVRGKVECSLYYELTEDQPSGIINEPVVRSYYQKLEQIARELGQGAGKDLLSTVMRLPDTMKNEKAELGEEEWKAVRAAIRDALGALDDFRSSEGKSLEEDLGGRVSAISELLAGTAAFEKERIDRVRQRIVRHLDEVVEKDSVDQNRLEQELVFYIEKLDVSEEKVRLAKHCEYFLETMGRNDANGKKLGFISQEMGREINTLGSKANHAELQKLVVDMKDELERIKEQVLNAL